MKQKLVQTFTKYCWPPSSCSPVGAVSELLFWEKAGSQSELQPHDLALNWLVWSRSTDLTFMRAGIVGHRCYLSVQL